MARIGARQIWEQGPALTVRPSARSDGMGGLRGRFDLRLSFVEAINKRADHNAVQPCRARSLALGEHALAVKLNYRGEHRGQAGPICAGHIVAHAIERGVDDGLAFVAAAFSGAHSDTSKSPTAAGRERPAMFFTACRK